MKTVTTTIEVTMSFGDKASEDVIENFFHNAIQTGLHEQTNGRGGFFDEIPEVVVTVETD